MKATALALVLDLTLPSGVGCVCKGVGVVVVEVAAAVDVVGMMKATALAMVLDLTLPSGVVGMMRATAPVLALALTLSPDATSGSTGTHQPYLHTLTRVKCSCQGTIHRRSEHLLQSTHPHTLPWPAPAAQMSGRLLRNRTARPRSHQPPHSARAWPGAGASCCHRCRRVPTLASCRWGDDAL